MNRILWIALLSCLAAAPGLAQVNTENAGTLSPEIPALRETILYLRYENADELRWSQQFFYALDNRNELRLAVPLVQKNVFDQSSTFAPGDVSLRYKHVLWVNNGVMQSDRWALLLETIAPSGDVGARGANGLLLPDRLQIGSGTWWLGVGTGYTTINDRSRFAVEAMLREPISGSGDHFGTTLDLNVAYWYRLTPAEFPEEGQPVEVRGVLELLSTYRFNSREDGLVLPDQGWIVWAAPGLQIYPSEDVLLEGSFLLPVFQDVQDALGRRQWGVTGSVKIFF
jgi:hypothetical protein